LQQFDAAPSGHVANTEHPFLSGVIPLTVTLLLHVGVCVSELVHPAKLDAAAIANEATSATAIARGLDGGVCMALLTWRWRS
jgi:hypothetical protein